MCDVIKIHLKGKDERRNGKGEKRDGFRHFYDVTHDTSRISCLGETYKGKIILLANKLEKKVL